MDVFNLAAQITLNSKQFEEALGQSEGSLAKLGKSIIKTQAMVKGLEMGFNAMKQIVSGGIDAYENYEQLVGGVDTLFKSGSQRVQEYAKNAFSTAGMSANQYMETVTSFSASLIQGMKSSAQEAAGTTQLTSEQLAKMYQDAADVADIAIRDMSDNANKMGTDMQSIQNAYQGFAKGNFMMLDNLKLGYGGTKTEMVRLINDSGVLNKKIKSIDEVSFDQMIMAIHAIQQELGITGTTAEEAAETISGSKSSMLAAFQNLLTFATDGTDAEALQQAQDGFVSSFAAYFNNNLAPRIVAGLKGSGDVFFAIVKALLTIPEGTLGEFVSAGLGSASDFLKALTKVTGWLFDQLAGVLTNPKLTQEDSQKFGESLGTFVGNFVKEGIKHLPEVIPGLFELGINLADGILEGLISGLFGGESETGEAMKEITETEQEAITDANKKAIKAEGLISFLDELQQKYGDAAKNMPEWERAIKALIELQPDYAYFFDSETKALNTSTDAMRKYTEEKRNLALQEARDRALSSKKELWLDAQAKLYSTQVDIEMKQSEYDSARKQLIDYMRASGDTSFTGEGLSADQLAYAVQARLKEVTGGEGNQAYIDQKPVIDAWISTMKESDGELSTLKGSIKELEDTVKLTETNYLTAAATMDQLTGSASGAASALQALLTPSVTYSSGEYYNWKYSHSHATGLDRVPFDGYVAELHRNEAILTSADADTWRRGGSSGVDYGEMARTISGAIIEGMGQVGFYFDRDQVAAAVTQRVSQNIADGMAAWGNA